MGLSTRTVCAALAALLLCACEGPYAAHEYSFMHPDPFRDAPRIACEQDIAANSLAFCVGTRGHPRERQMRSVYLVLANRPPTPRVPNGYPNVEPVRFSPFSFRFAPLRGYKAKSDFRLLNVYTEHYDNGQLIVFAHGFGCPNSYLAQIWPSTIDRAGLLSRPDFLAWFSLASAPEFADGRLTLHRRDGRVLTLARDDRFEACGGSYREMR